MLSIVYQQRNLKYNGYYYTGAIDGIKGAGTRNAIKAFQKAYGLTADGIWGVKTDAKSIKVNKDLQAQLNAKGYKLTVDGMIGTKTVAAIKDLQKKHKLTADGIVGSATRKILKTSDAPSATGWKTVKHFKRAEFACDCGGRYCNGFPEEMDMGLIKLLDKLRDYYGKPITITSGVRCKKRNAEVGGISNSEHLKGNAADIYIPGVTDTTAGRNKVIKKAYALGAAYSYANTPGMGNAVHINV